MGPALSMRSKQLAGQTAGYASVAGNAEMQRIHNKHEGLFNSQGAPSAADIDKCPHASAARRPAELARAMADAKVAKAAAPAPAPEPALVQVSARATPQDVVSILNNMNTNLQPHVNALSMSLHTHRCISY